MKVYLPLFGALVGLGVLHAIFVSYKVMNQCYFSTIHPFLGKPMKSESRKAKRQRRVGECINFSPTIPSDWVP